MNRFSAKFGVALLSSGALAVSATAYAQTPPPAQPAPQGTPPADPPRTPDRTNPVDDPARPAGSQSTAQTSQPTQAVDVDDQQVRSFAMALVEVDRIQQQYQPRLESAGTAERPALEQEANQRMTEVVVAQGLEPETFNAISMTAQQDPELRERIQQELASLQPATPPSR